MQRNIKNKITFFTFGLLAGVTIGVVFGVAIKALFGHLNDIHIGMVKLGSKEEQISQRLDSIEGKMADNKKKTIVVVAKNNTPAKTNNKLFAENTNKTAKDSARQLTDGQDSLSLVNNDNADEDSTQNVVVMTNQLVSIANVGVVNLDTVKNQKSRAAEQADSAIVTLNGTAEIKPSASYRVEFWESPLNFRGYKMSLGKIIVYGISSHAALKMIKMDDAYYLVANRDAYRVEYTDDLKQFDKVTDKAILKKLSL